MTFHQFVQDGPGWETVKSEVEYASPYLQLWNVEVRTPTRHEPIKWSVVHRKGAAVVAPVTAEGNLLLVRQERVPIRESIWEFPAGQIDESSLHDDQAIRSTALRELREESGYELAEGGELIPIGHFFPSCGFTDEHSYLFIAKPVVPSPLGQELDQQEAISECRAFSPAEFRAMVASNEIKDANTLCAFARMCALGFL